MWHAGENCPNEIKNIVKKELSNVTSEGEIWDFFPSSVGAGLLFSYWQGLAMIRPRSDTKAKGGDKRIRKEKRGQTTGMRRKERKPIRRGTRVRRQWKKVFTLRQHINYNWGYKREPLFLHWEATILFLSFSTQNFMLIPGSFPFWFLGAAPLPPPLQSWLLWRTFLSTQNCCG